MGQVAVPYLNFRDPFGPHLYMYPADKRVKSMGKALDPETQFLLSSSSQELATGSYIDEMGWEVWLHC